MDASGSCSAKPARASCWNVVLERSERKRSTHCCQFVMPLDVLLVDDHKIMRDGIKAILSRSAEFRVVGEAENGTEAGPSSASGSDHSSGDHADISDCPA